MNNIDNQVLETNFYTFHLSDRVILGVMLQGFGVFAEEFGEAEWVQWLREELRRSHPAEIPSVFLQEEANGKTPSNSEGASG